MVLALDAHIIGAVGYGAEGARVFGGKGIRGAAGGTIARETGLGVVLLQIGIAAWHKTEVDAARARDGLGRGDGRGA